MFTHYCATPVRREHSVPVFSHGFVFVQLLLEVAYDAPLHQHKMVIIRKFTSNCSTNAPVRSSDNSNLGLVHDGYHRSMLRHAWPQSIQKLWQLLVLVMSVFVGLDSFKGSRLFYSRKTARLA
jgi:hypothetical protein